MTDDDTRTPRGCLLGCLPALLLWACVGLLTGGALALLGFR